jgi:hypothetical protein
MKNNKINIGLIIIIFIISSCINQTRKVENLQTFAKVYGYVRWFYPGDEVSEVNWAKFTVYGVRKVENAKNPKELKDLLLDLFKPIAPSLQIEEALHNPKFDLKSIIPNDTTGFKPIYWIHYGVYLSERSNIYKSIRINRKTASSENKIDADPTSLETINKSVNIGESISKDIGNNLICIMPLVLYGTEKHTYPIPDTVSLIRLNEQLRHIPDSDLNTKNIGVKLANVVIAWNVLQHFYPYFDVVHIDWKEVLSQTLGRVYNGKTEQDYYKTLCSMISKLDDGHGVVYNNNIVQWGLPVSFAWIENEVVISGSKSPLFERGDVIKIIDGKSALDELITQESLVSGSPQLKRYRALNLFGTDFSQTVTNITLIRDEKTLKIKAKRELRCNLFFNEIGMPNLKNGELANGIYYENSRQTDFDKELSNLVKAKGVIVAPLSDISKLIPHLIKDTVWSPLWNIPVTLRPDRENVSFYTGRWKIEPQRPLINAKIVFIEEPFNVSSGETFLSFVDHYKLGKLVGDTTAGTNGNVNYIPLMGGYSIMWTGMKVLKQDGSQHHLIGYRPNYPVKRTIQAIKESRDEYLDKALEILKN